MENGLQLYTLKVVVRYNQFHIFRKKTARHQYLLNYFNFSFIVYRVVEVLGLINGLLNDWLMELLILSLLMVILVLVEELWTLFLVLMINLLMDLLMD